MNILPVLLKDGYKVGHIFQYPTDTLCVYSNLTPRNTRRSDGAKVSYKTYSSTEKSCANKLLLTSERSSRLRYEDFIVNTRQRIQISRWSATCKVV